MPSSFRACWKQAIVGSIDASYRQNRDENEAYRGLAARQAALFKEIQDKLGKDARLLNRLEEISSEKETGTTGRALPTASTCSAGRACFPPNCKIPLGIVPGGFLYLALLTSRATTVMSSSR